MPETVAHPPGYYKRPADRRPIPHPEFAIARPTWHDYAALAAGEIEQLRLLLAHGARRLRLPKRRGAFST